MPISFYKILLLLFVVIIVYFNISLPINNGVFLSIYPYLLSFATLLSIFFLIIYFLKNDVVINIAHTIMALFLIFFVFTFVQVFRDISVSANYDIEKGNSKTTTSFNNEALIIYNDVAMFDEIIEEISKAEDHIHIEFFILRDDSIGQKFKDILTQKAKEGVEVRIIYDGLGSINLKRRYYKELEDVGVNIKAHDNVFQSIIKGKLNYRNHRKIVIVDGEIGFTGGINIGDEYLGRDDSIGNWKDVLVKISGEAVHDMQKIFLNDWYYVSGEKLIEDRYITKTVVENSLPVQIVAGAYDANRNEISESFLSIINSAEKSLYIVTPYFVPTNKIMSAIQSAASNGVDVNIILPKNPDHFLVGWVNASFFDELLKSKVRLYLYEDGFLHSKVFVADNKTVSIGSANLNMRSQYLDYEMNAVLYDENQSELMIKELYKSIGDSKEILLEDYNKRSLTQRIKEKLGVFIRPLV